MGFVGAPHLANLKKKRFCERKTWQVEKSEREEGGWPEGAGLRDLPALTILQRVLTRCSEEGVIIFSKGFLMYH